ncbi:exotoxin [Streptococcus halichoeri]|uniref:exotoxin n=1 Tax=Streptococcus halichoeri TaxID=254785 RepID=UPI001359955C|nr:exotoxin [Streptococcus halichoeri]
MNKNKKVLKKLVFFILTMLVGLITSQRVFAQQDPDPSQLHRASLVKNLQNIYFLYESDPIIHENVKSVSQLLSHDLIYNVSGLNYDKLKTELKNQEMATLFKDKNVDLYGVGYYYLCFLCENSERKACIYGGVTSREENHLEIPKKIVVKVSIDGTQSLSFDIATNKKIATAQELDYKVRKYLTDNKQLYTNGTSKYETGYIKFISKDKESFWFDLFPEPEYTQVKYLMIYKDNETLDSSTTQIEVHLTTK